MVVRLKCPLAYLIILHPLAFHPDQNIFMDLQNIFTEHVRW